MLYDNKDSKIINNIRNYYSSFGIMRNIICVYVAIGRLYTRRMVLLPGAMYCTWNGSDSIVVWGLFIMCGTGF